MILAGARWRRTPVDAVTPRSTSAYPGEFDSEISDLAGSSALNPLRQVFSYNVFDCLRLEGVSSTLERVSLG